MNRASLDRGFGRCIVLKKAQTVLKKYPNRTQDRVVAPAPGGVYALYVFFCDSHLNDLHSLKNSEAVK